MARLGFSSKPSANTLRRLAWNKRSNSYENLRLLETGLRSGDDWQRLTVENLATSNAFISGEQEQNTMYGHSISHSGSSTPYGSAVSHLDGSSIPQDSRRFSCFQPRYRRPFARYRGYVMISAVLVMVVFFALRLFGADPPQRPAYLTEVIPYNASVLPNAAFQPPEMLPHRGPDIVDTFANYKYRSTCDISSLDLHAPFAPLCHDRKSMLTAMSSGGRVGNDSPYMPRGCDMRWFATEEICEILSRFEKVIVVGDSMMRHVIGSINVLIRKDLGYGAVTNWNFSPEERRECFCNYQFNVKACSIQGIFKTSDVVKNDPESLACPADTVNVMIEEMVRFPIPSEELTRLREQLPTTKPSRPYAFIYGHGLWNDLDLQATVDWLDTVLDTTIAQAPWLSPSHKKGGKTKFSSHERKQETGFWPRLFLTPNAPGFDKPDEWYMSQGHKAIGIFETEAAIEVNRRGVEHLGTYNMSIQSNKYDGVHLDLKGNLIKGMMVLNWLNMLEVEKF